MQDQQLRTNETPFVDLSARQLRAFATVASTLSYVDAGDVLHYTEPGVYAQVKQLERLVGCKLFERAGRGLRLTAEGAALLPACRSSLAELERIDAIRQQFSRQRRIAISAGCATGSYLLPPLIRKFGEQGSRIPVEIATGPAEDVMGLVAAGAADIGVCGGIHRLPLPAHHTLIHWLDIPYSLLTNGSAPRRLIAPVVIYILPHSPHLMSTVSENLEALGVRGCELRSLASVDAIKGACQAGLGYGMIPRRAAQFELGAGLLAEVEGFAGSIMSQVWICQPPEERLSNEARIFRDFLLCNGDTCLGDA